LQPLVRFWGRNRHRNGAAGELGDGQRLPEAIRAVPGGIILLPEDRPRLELAAGMVSVLRARGIRALPSSGWEDYDARLLLSAFAYGELQTSSHPEGFVQVRIRMRPRIRRLTAGLVMTIAAALIDPLLGALAVVPAFSLVNGAIQAHRLPAL